MIKKMPWIKFAMGLSGSLVKIISLPYNLLDGRGRNAIMLAKSCGKGPSHSFQPAERSAPALAKPADFAAEMTGGLVSFGLIYQWRIFFAADLLSVGAAGMEVATRGRVDR